MSGDGPSMNDSGLVSGAAFRAACGRFATGVAVVTALDANGGNWGLTVNSFSSVSLDPPLILFSIDNGATSLSGFKTASSYAVNILTTEQTALSERFSAVSDQDRFVGVPLESSAGAPVISDCLCSIECAPESIVAGGDHTVFIARVVATRLNSDEGLQPLLYYRGGYAGLRG